MAIFAASSHYPISNDSIDDVLNSSKRLVIHGNKSCNFFISSSPNSIQQTKKIFEDENWLIGFSGDLLGYDKIPYDLIIEILENRTFTKLKELNGVFAIVIYHKIEKVYYVISDRRSQFPIYYYINNDHYIFSSELSGFCRVLNYPKFNSNWLYDYLFFNFPIDGISFVKDVYKLPPASILIFNQNSAQYSIKEYAPNFNKKDKLFTGKPALEYAKEIFTKSLKTSLGNSNSKVAVALTGGWDSRTNLALISENEKVSTYTYGGQYCEDMVMADKISKKLKLNHHAIYFEDSLLKDLPKLMFETIYFSSGEQGILRSTLLYVYKHLNELIPDLDIILSGIMMDTMFRGHIGMPVLTPQHIIKIFNTGVVDIEKSVWKPIFNNDYDSFSNYILNDFQILQNRFGNLTGEEFYILYVIYIASQNHFLGEYKIASNFNTMRVTAWDNDIIDLAFSIDYSCLKTARKPKELWKSKDEFILQSYLISSYSEVLSKIPIQNVNPNAILKGDLYYNCFKKYQRIYNSIAKRVNFWHKNTYLENWENWINVLHKEFIDNLIFSKESLIQEYIDERYLQFLRVNRDYRMIGKLVSTEIILNLINNKWVKFW